MITELKTRRGPLQSSQVGLQTLIQNPRSMITFPGARLLYHKTRNKVRYFLFYLVFQVACLGDFFFF